MLGDVEVEHPSSIVTKNNDSIEEPNVAVATTNMSAAAMSVTWFCRMLRQVGEGSFRRHGIYLPTVA